MAALACQPASPDSLADAGAQRDRGAPSLFDDHASWARGVATAVYRRVWRSGIDRADCIQNGMLGLLEAMERFDAARGVPFRAYALPRVRGAVFNGLRVHRDAPGAWEGAVAQRVHSLETDAADDGIDTFSQLVGALGVGFLLEDAWERTSDDAFACAEQAQVTARLLAAVRDLPERHRVLLHHHYYQHRPFAELVTRWGVSKGRVSQLHHEALARLKTALHNRI